MPVTKKIYDALKQWIENESFKEGMYLPSERELARLFSTSRVTIREALAYLEKEGWIIREPHCRPVVRVHQPQEKVAALSKTKLIGFYSEVPLISRILCENSELSNVVAAAVTRLERAGWYVAYVNTYGHNLGQDEVWNALVPEGLAGMIIYPPLGVLNREMRDQILKHSIPVVVVEGHLDEKDDSRIHSVELDGREGMKQITKYALELGHRRIIYVTMEGDYPWLRLRDEGVYEAVSQCPDGMLKVVKVPPFTNDLVLLESVWDDVKNSEATLVMAVTDQLAINLRNVALKRGIHIPRDVSLTGFDNLQLAVDIKLTTVSHMSEELGHMAGEILHHVLTESKVSIVYRKWITPRIVIRDSLIPVSN